MFLDSDIVNNIPVLLLVQVLTVSYPLDFSFCSSIFILRFMELFALTVALHSAFMPETFKLTEQLVILV